MIYIFFFFWWGGGATLTSTLQVGGTRDVDGGSINRLGNTDLLSIQRRLRNCRRCQRLFLTLTETAVETAILLMIIVLVTTVCESDVRTVSRDEEKERRGI